MNILLIGNPNVGKSTLFSRLTGINVMVSNYPGTTVEFKQGLMKGPNGIANIIDVPGTYCLKANCKAEKVAIDMLKKGDIIINVVDATNLERNLNLTLQLLEKNIPVIIALNFWNETRHKGIKIDIEKLESRLGVPIVPTVAVTGEGIKKLTAKLQDARKKKLSLDDNKRWAKIGKIIDEVQEINSKRHTFLERLEDLTIKPRTGLPIAVLVLLMMFVFVWMIGEGIIRYIMTPLFGLYMPFLEWLNRILNPGIIHDILIGSTENGIDFVGSLGLLSTGVFVPIGMILPYIFGFYIVVGLLEDSGYISTLAALVDNFMHKIGMHGIAIVPTMLGLGCNVPGVLASRLLETRRQRFIVITLMSITIPCMSQIAMIFGLLGSDLRGIATVFITLIAVWFILGFIMNRGMKGAVLETFMEITPYRMPDLKSFPKKLIMRLKSFISEAIPFVFLGVLIINLLYFSGIIEILGNITSPLIETLMGLPREAIGTLIVGFLRKDVAVGMLVPLGLTLKQMIIASVVLTMYFPCIATFSIIYKELGFIDTLKSTGIMIASTITVGGLLNLFL